MQNKLNLSTDIIISIPNISMKIDKIVDNVADAFLEINTNKFWIKIAWDEYDRMDGFEIISAKGFFDLDISLIKIIRNIVQNLLNLVNKNTFLIYSH